MAQYALITGFKAFGGRSRNLSEDLVAGLNKVPVQKLILPVAADEASQIVINFVKENGPPLWALSFGEVGDNIKIETRVHDPKALIPLSLGMTLPLGRLLQIIKAGKAVYSLSAGLSICNNMAFILNTFFRRTRTPYGFIHVPQFLENGSTQEKKKQFGDCNLVLKEVLTLFTDDTPYSEGPASSEEVEKFLKATPTNKEEKEYLQHLAQMYARETVNLPSVFLDTRPKINTLRVLYKGIEIPSGEKDKGGLWFYDSKINGILFYDLDFADGDADDVVVDYEDKD